MHSNDYVHKCLDTKCCNNFCLRSWTWNEIKSYTSQNANLTNKEKKEKLKPLLMNMQDENGTHKVEGNIFNLKVHGKSLCPAAFNLIFGVSHGTLQKIVREMMDNVDPNPEEDEANAEWNEGECHQTQQDRIFIFLKFLLESDLFSEPMVGYPECYRRITLFPNKEIVYEVFTTGKQNNITIDEFQKFIDTDHNPITFDWFQ